MPNTSVLWPEVDVESNRSGCTYAISIQVKPGIETRPRAAKPTEARLGEALLEGHRIRSGSPMLDALGSLLLHAAVIGSVLLLPFWYTDTLDLQSYTRTLVVGPPPSPPPPPAPVAAVKASASASRRNLFSSGKLLAPVAIPKQVVILKEAPMPGEAELVGVPGGVPGGQLGGVIGGILGGIPAAITKVPARPPEKMRSPIRVGGRVRAPRPVYQPAPDYPHLAKQARVQGDVIIDAVLDKTGSVVEMKVVSGPVLLIPAALAAVRTWKYQPTYLNEEPIDVQLFVTVHFELQN